MGSGLNALPIAMHAAAAAAEKYYDEALQTPLTYYHRTGPIGQIMAAYNDPKNPKELPRVGLIGLGTGTMSCYAKKDQHFTFYDIDPKVVKIAQNKRLLYVLERRRGPGANMHLIINDARLAIDTAGGRVPRSAGGGKVQDHGDRRVQLRRHSDSPDHAGGAADLSEGPARTA